jgi:hypothetical protein
MPMFFLNRTFKLVHDDGPACVICAPRAVLSAAWCARIAVNPADPHGLSNRDFLQADPGAPADPEVRTYDGLVPEVYDAHSCLRSREAQSVSSGCAGPGPSRFRAAGGGRGLVQNASSIHSGRGPQDATRTD